MKTIYVGNLSYSSSEDNVRDLFAQHGTIHSVKLVSDRDTGLSRGFCFVEMEPEAAQAAIAALDGSEFGGRTIRVKEARELSARPQRRSF